jgi:3-methyladenine DNA glycosylase AlkD
MDVAAEREAILNRILSRADPDHREGMRIAVQTHLQMYGVRVPALREIAKTWYQANKDVARDDFMALIEALWVGASREERMVAIYLLIHFKRWIPDLTWDHFVRWTRDLDNWEINDGLAQWVLGRWLLDDPDARLDHLWDLIADEDVWKRRLALIATVWLNRGRKDVSYPELTLAFVDRAKADRHPMITKAVSWALRVMGTKHPERVAAYVEGNRDVLAGHVVREVENKLRTGLKSG